MGLLAPPNGSCSTEDCNSMSQSGTAVAGRCSTGPPTGEHWGEELRASERIVEDVEEGRALCQRIEHRDELQASTKGARAIPLSTHACTRGCTRGCTRARTCSHARTHSGLCKVSQGFKAKTIRCGWCGEIWIARSAQARVTRPQKRPSASARFSHTLLRVPARARAQP